MNETEKWMTLAETNTAYLEGVIQQLHDRLARADKFERVAERFYNTDPHDLAAMQFAYMAYEEARDGRRSTGTNWRGVAETLAARLRLVDCDCRGRCHCGITDALADYEEAVRGGR